MPNPWPLVPLEELLTPVSRSQTVQAEETYRIIGAHWYAQGLYVKGVTTGAGIQAKALYRVEEGDFVYNRLFAWKGSFAVATKENGGCYVSNEFPCFTVNSPRVDGKFLWRYFSRTSVWDEALSESTGGTPTSRNRLKENKFLAFKVPLPSLDEQRRIVARIEQLAAKIEQTRALRRQAAEGAEALVGRATEALFAGAGKSYSSEPLGNHVKIQGGYAFRSNEYLEAGLPIVRIANLENETVHTDGSQCMHQSRLSEFSRFVLKPGDILIAMTGATTGKLGIVPASCRNWLLNQRVGRFLAKKPGELEPKYVYWLARGVQKHIFETAYGGAQPNISPNDIEAMEFPFPQITDQRRIVAHLDALQAKVEALKRLQAETAAELDALLPSILDRAFHGEL